MIKKAEIFVVLLLFLLLIFINSSESLRFDLKSQFTRCIYEDIRRGSIAVGKYHVVNPNEGHPLPDSHKIIASVSNDHGRSYHYADKVESGQFSFTAIDEGSHFACFYVSDATQESTVTIDFEWKTGVEAVDWASVAKREKLNAVELELKKMQTSLESIHEELGNAYIREEGALEFNTSTNSYMLWLSFGSLIFSLSVAGLQFWHLKTFFVRKKLL